MLGNGVIARLPEWITTKDPPDRKDRTLNKPVSLVGLYGVLRAGGVKAAMRAAGQRGNKFLIKTNQTNGKTSHDTESSRKTAS